MITELIENLMKGKESKSMTAELKECPYCGGDGELYVYSTNSRDKKLYLVRCENCGNGTCCFGQSFEQIIFLVFSQAIRWD